MTNLFLLKRATRQEAKLSFARDRIHSQGNARIAALDQWAKHG